MCNLEKEVIMKKIKKIMMSALTALYLTATTLGATSCVEGKAWMEDYYIHNGHTYLYVPGFEENVSQKVNDGFALVTQMFISEVYTDVSDKDRNFMCMDAYFALHSVYIKEDFVDNFSDIRTLKINEMTLDAKYDFIIRKEFKFGDILAETPVIKTVIPKDWTYKALYTRCYLADYPLYYTDIDIYSDGVSVWVKLKEDSQEYYQVVDEEYQTIFLDTCFLRKI